MLRLIRSKKEPLLRGRVLVPDGSGPAPVTAPLELVPVFVSPPTRFRTGLRLRPRLANRETRLALSLNDSSLSKGLNLRGGGTRNLLKVIQHCHVTSTVTVSMQVLKVNP